MKQNTFTKHAQLLSAVSVLVLSQAAFAQTTSEQAGAEQSAETEELSFDSLMTTLDENNTAVANVAPVVVEMTYPTEKEIVRAIKYSLEVGYVMQDAAVPVMKDMHSRIGMFSSVSSMYLRLKYKTTNLAKIVPAIEKQLQPLLAQHQQNTEWLQTAGVLAQQVLDYNYKNRQANGQFQRLIGVRADGAIGNGTKMAAVKLINDRIAQDQQLVQRIFDLMWEQKAAEVLADTHYGHFLLENKGKKPYIHSEGEGDVARIDLPRRMTIPNWIDIMYNPKYQNMNSDGQPAEEPSTFEEFGVLDDNMDSLWNAQEEVERYIKATRLTEFEQAFMTDPDARSKNPNSAVFFYHPMQMELHANRRIFGGGSSEVVSSADILTPAQRDAFAGYFTSDNMLVEKMAVNAVNFVPQGQLLGQAVRKEGDPATAGFFSNSDIYRMSGEVKLVVQDKSEINLDFFWKHSQHEAGECTAVVTAGGKEVKQFQNNTYSWSLVVDPQKRNKKRITAPIKLDVSCPAGDGSQSGFEAFGIKGYYVHPDNPLKTGDIPHVQGKTENRNDVFALGDRYNPPVMQVLEYSKNGSVKGSGHIFYDLQKINALSDYSQKAGLRDGLHDKQQILSSQFIPKHEGVYEFIIETESNVCSTAESPARFQMPILTKEEKESARWEGRNIDKSKWGANGDHNMGKGDLTALAQDNAPRVAKDIVSSEEVCSGFKLSHPEVIITANEQAVGSNGIVDSISTSGTTLHYNQQTQTDEDGDVTFQGGSTTEGIYRVAVPMNVTKEMVGSPIDMAFHIYSNISYNDEDADNWSYSKRYGKAIADTKGEASIDARIQKEVLWASDEFKGYQTASFFVRAPHELYYRPLTAEDFVNRDAARELQYEQIDNGVNFDDPTVGSEWEGELTESSDDLFSDSNLELDSLDSDDFVLDDGEEGELSLDTVDDLFSGN